MKRHIALLAFLLCVISAGALAQRSTMDEQAEKNITITQGPSITDNMGNTATIAWTTSATAANHVKYRVGGGAWKSAYQPGGSTNHSLQLTGLQPGQTVEWQILTRDGDIRTSGQFQAGAGNAVAAGGPGTGGAAAVQHVPIYRADNAQTGQHLYTTNQGEIAGVQGQGWTSRGIVGYVSAGQAPGTVPLYRLSGPNGDHLYTTDANERNSLLGQGWRDEGVVGYVATSQQPGTQPLHRMVSTKTGMHFYSAYGPEVVEATTHQGYREEGVIGYVWEQ
jgi:hypothetical protein